MTESFPSTEMYGLASQMRRAVVSISSNIAEGAGRETNKDFCRFLDIAIGSAFEVETQVVLATDLDFTTEECSNVVFKNLHELQNMIYGFKKYLAKS